MIKFNNIKVILILLTIMESAISSRTELNFKDYASNIITILKKSSQDLTDVNDIISRYNKDYVYAAPEMLSNISNKYKARLFKYIQTLQHNFEKDIDLEFATFFDNYT